MPQLMPLPWVLSFFVVVLFVFMLSIIYSNIMLSVGESISKKFKMNLVWFW